MTTWSRVVAPRAVEARFVQQRMRSGRNQPLLLRTADAQGNPVLCIVKLRRHLAAPPSEYLFEWLGAVTARRIGIAAPEPLAVMITPAFVASADESFRGELQGSIGLVFGSQLVSSAVPMANRAALASTHKASAALILAFDVFIHNVDRRAINPNLLVGPNELVAFDHELAFAFLFAIGAPDPVTDSCPGIVENHALLTVVRRFPPKPEGIRTALALLDDEFLADVEAATPVEWTVDGARGKLRQIVETLKRRRDAIDEWLPKVLVCLKP